MGFSLLDAVLGSSIFLFGVVASAPMLTETVRAANRADRLVSATEVAQRQMTSVRSAIRRGESVASGVVDEGGFHVVQSVDVTDPDFFRIGVYVFPKDDNRMLVEMIGLVEKP